MTVSVTRNAFVDQTSTTIDMSSVFADTAVAGNPSYLVLTALDRNEYTAGASGATGSFAGNGHTLDFGGIGSDGRGAGIVFAYQATTGRYYNNTYGYLDQLTYTSSSSLDDVTNLSLFGTNSLTLANSYADNAYDMMQVDATGYIGSATIVTEPSFTGTVLSQATPDSVAAVADSFVGKAWNMDGCWVLASTIAAEAGASLPVQSTAIGVPGQSTGEWIVAFNGPAGQSGNWESMVTAGEVIVIGTAGGGGHITTCVSGSGSSAQLVDNITYVNGSGQVQNGANDGSSNDVIVASPHAASQEWSGVRASSVVIYELDTPVVSNRVASDSLACTASQSLASLFTAVDPASKAIVGWQLYDSAGTNSFVSGGTASADHSAAAALTVSSLSVVSLLAGSVATSDVLEARAFNGAYWGDWQSLNVTVTANAVATPAPLPAPAPTPAPAPLPPPAPAASPPVVAAQIATVTWLAGHSITLALPAGTFHDPRTQTLSYAATLSTGQPLPTWLTFNKAMDTFTGIAPATAQTLKIAVKATDTSGLSVSDTFSATVIGAPVVSMPTANQTWTERQAFSLTLPLQTFSDPQKQTLAYTATQAGGQALPSWLTFHAATGSFTGTAPSAPQTLTIKVTATDSSGLATSETFNATVKAPPAPRPAITVTTQTPAQVWNDQQTRDVVLPSSTFTDSLGLPMRFAAYQTSGPNVTSWLRFNSSTDIFSGLVPATQTGTVGLEVIATDAAHLSARDMFTVTFAAGASHVRSATHGVSAIIRDPVLTPISTPIALHS